ncbi:MAG: hypothetical protein KGP14_02995 [Betaproteobacteria bacterium]|nr:hypothetical protein [Betaproteobacteria bacterium]
MKKPLKHYVGKLVQLRPGSFSSLLGRMGFKSKGLENRFLVSTANRSRGRLICYGSGLCLEIAPADIELV